MKTEETLVTVTIGDKEFSKSYMKKTYETEEELLSLMEKPETLKELLRDFNYGQDLKAKSEIRNKILAEQAGPEKAFEKSVRDFIKLREAMGKPVTEERAREIVKMTMES